MTNQERALRQVWGIIARCWKANKKPTQQDMINIMLICQDVLPKDDDDRPAA
jgi:hypothetical protein